MKKRDEKHLKKENRIPHLRSRILLGAVLISGMYMIPVMTEAKYEATINGFTALRAGEYYFTSDYLRDVSENKVYNVDGWDGENVSVKIELYNYENALLHNLENQDINYNFSIQLLDKNGNAYGEDGAYKAEILTKPENKVIKGGSLKNHVYEIKIEKNTQATALQAGDHIDLVVTAENSDENQFYRSLKATIRYKVATTSEFVTCEQDFENFMLSFQLKTKNVPGMDTATRTLQVWWDSSRFRVNQYGDDYIDLIAQGALDTSRSDNYYVLTLNNMGSASSRSLEFYAKNRFSYNKETDFAENKNVGTDGKAIGYYILPLETDLDTP